MEREKREKWYKYEVINNRYGYVEYFERRFSRFFESGELKIDGNVINVEEDACYCVVMNYLLYIRGNGHLRCVNRGSLKFLNDYNK